MIGVAFAAALAGLSQAPSQKVYLTCEVSSRPLVTKEDVYRTVPASSAQFTKDMLDFGTLTLFLSPPSTWVVDLANESVQPSDNDLFVFRLLRSSPTEIVAHRSSEEGTHFLLQINRVSGVATHTSMLDPAKQRAWLKKYGKPLPSHWIWKQQCNGAAAPRF